MGSVPTGNEIAEEVEGTPLVIGQVTVVAVAAAGGGKEAVQDGPGGTAAAEE